MEVELWSGGRMWWSFFVSGSREIRLETESGYKYSKAPSDPLLTSILKKAPPTMSSSGDQMFKHTSLWGTFKI